MNENEQKQQTIERDLQGLQTYELSDTDFEIIILLHSKRQKRL